MKIGLIGKTNVGKSTLFNRINQSYRAIVTDVYGTTRETLKEKIKLDDDKSAVLMDSPGLDISDDKKQTIDKLIKDCDILLFVVDSKNQIGAKDQKIKQRIINGGMKDNTILVVNKLDGKIDSDEYQLSISDYYNLGFSNVRGVSAKTNKGINDLKKDVIKLAEKQDIDFGIKDNKGGDYVDISIIGRPNTGKSTLLNSYMGDEIAKVKDEWNTTLDYNTGVMEYKNVSYKFYDTSGIRKQGQIQGLERIAFNKTKKMLEYVRPIVILMIDGEEGIVHRDRSLFSQIQKYRLPVLIAVNKMDQLEGKAYERTFEKVVDFFRFARWVPILPISATRGTGLKRVLKFVDNIRGEYGKHIPTSKLNKALQKVWINNPPRFPKNKICKFYYATQVENTPPKFKVYINNDEHLNFAFKKWVENAIREQFGFVGIPLEFEYIDKSGLSQKKKQKIKKKGIRGND